MIHRFYQLTILFYGVLCTGLFATSSSRPSECYKILEKLDWIKVNYTNDEAGQKILISSLKHNKAFAMLPQHLKEKISTPRSGSEYSTLDSTGRENLRDWAHQLIQKRVTHLSKATPNLRQLDFWMYDKNGSEASFAIRRHLKPEVGFFGVGHGKPGGDFHSLYPIMAGNIPLLRIKIDINKMIEVYAKLPGVKKSQYIFYKTCSGGLGTENSTADAIRLAQATGVPVIAPMGILRYHTKTTETGQKIWAFKVKASKDQPPLDKDLAYRVFTSDGKSQPIRFQEVKELLFRPEAQSLVQYITP